MILEISLTKKLADALGFKNLKKTTSTSGEYHYYADIITRNRQKTILFMNTQYLWVCLQSLKSFKKDYINSFGSSFLLFIRNEGLKEYIPLNYLKEIDGVKITLTNSASLVAKMNVFKKDINLIYDSYYNVPDAITLCLDRDPNNTVFGSSVNEAYFPLESFCSFLLEKYKDDKIEIEHLLEYNSKKNELFKDQITKPRDLTKLTHQQLEDLIARYNKAEHVFISIYQIEGFINKYPNYSMEDCYEFVYSRNFFYTSNEEIISLCELFNISFDIFILYTKYHNKNYCKKYF